jgi:hypothetical protein
MPLHFDGDLPRITADKLKPMARLWGGASTMPKAACISCIQHGLANPDKVQGVVAGLEPWERNALALIKRMGGTLEFQALTVGIVASGICPPHRDSAYRDEFVHKLFRKGLVLAANSYSPDYISDSYGGGSALYTDERLLAHVGFPEFRTLDVRPVATGSDTRYRLPSTVVLDIVGMLQAIEDIGGLQLTQAGTVRASDQNKVRKAMRWGEKGLEIDGFFFPDPVAAWVSAFRHSDLLVLQDDNHLIVSESSASFAERPYGEQVRLLLEGFIRAPSWSETPQRAFFDPDGGRVRRGRLALTMALSALPLDTAALFSFEAFDQALFERIGEDFSLSYVPQRPFSLRSHTAAEQAQEMAAWRARLRANWQQEEGPWLAKAFTTWLYFLGLVELAVEKGTVIGFRLTDIGRAAFHPELQDLTPAVGAGSQSSSQSVWVVQPNFDVVVYLDHASAPQLAFLERHAERVQTDRRTAHYRLTRESVYRGLESGTTLADLLDGLQEGFQHALPQNVTTELREWASLRERITLRRGARLLEFQTARALQGALAQGQSGKVVGERFLLLEHGAMPDRQLTSINYARALPRGLAIEEDGRVHLGRGPHDLMIETQVSQWAVALADREWLLTAESVSRQLKTGRKISELLGLLKERSTESISPLLEVALRSWTGETYPVELDAVTVLRCPQEQLFQAILSSEMLRPFLKGYLPPNLFFVDAQQLDVFRARLDWLGCAVSDQLRVSPLAHN